MSIDCASMVAAANSSINQLRRELKPPTGPTKMLFGDNLSEHVKAANTTSSLMAAGGRGMFGAHQHFSPYGQPLYGGYGPYAGYQ